MPGLFSVEIQSNSHMVLGARQEGGAGKFKHSPIRRPGDRTQRGRRKVSD